MRIYKCGQEIIVIAPRGAPLVLSLSGCARCFLSGLSRLVWVGIERRASRRRCVIRRAASLSLWESSVASRQMALRAGMRRDATRRILSCQKLPSRSAVHVRSDFYAKKLWKIFIEEERKRENPLSANLIL